MAGHHGERRAQRPGRRDRAPPYSTLRPRTFPFRVFPHRVFAHRVSRTGFPHGFPRRISRSATFRFRSERFHLNDGGTSVTAVMPEGVALARDLVGPAMESAIGRLTPDVRVVAAYHLGLADAEGHPTRRRQRQGAAARAGPAVCPRRRRAARARRDRRGRGRAGPQLLAAARRHHGRRHRTPAPPDRLDRVRRRARPSWPATRCSPSPRTCCWRTATPQGAWAARLPVRRGAAADRRPGLGPGLREARRRRRWPSAWRWRATRPPR